MSTKGAKKKNGAAASSKFYEGKRLAQSWIPEEDYEVLEGEAGRGMMKVATLMRQILHAEVERIRASRGE